MRTQTRFLAVLLPFALFASVDGQQGPVFRTQSNLVMVPVEVRSNDQHVAGLRKDKFTLLQDGKPQKIAVFEEVNTRAPRLRRAVTPPNEFTNRVQGSTEMVRYTVIAIDRINTATLDMQRVREGLLKFLNQSVAAGEPVRVVALDSSGIEIIQDFTTSLQVIARALERRLTPAGKPQESSGALNDSLQWMEGVITNNVADPEAEAAAVAARLQGLDDVKRAEQQSIAFQQRTQRINSLAALQMIAQSLQGLPGRKSLVWASSGYPFASLATEGRSSMTMNFGQVIEAGNLDEYTVRLLNDANIALYPVDARGTVNTAYDVMDPSHKYSATYAEKQATQFRNQEVISTFEHLAAATGGRPCYGREDLSGCFREALNDARDYYLLGFYVEGDLKPGWHKLRVKVAADANVRSRTGFIYTKPDPEQNRVNDMRLQLASVLADAGIPFRGQWSIAKAEGDRKDVGFEIKIFPEAGVVSDSDPHLNLEIVALARARDGTVAGQFAQKIDRRLSPDAVATITRAGIDYRNQMALPLGNYLVRLVIRDNNTGRMGSASTLVNVN